MIILFKSVLLIIWAVTFLAACETQSSPPEKPKTPETPPPVETSLPREMTGKDGAPMIMVPEGVYYMGTDDGKPEEGPRMNVFMEKFYIDRMEVSNGMFARFVKEAGYEPMKDFSFPDGEEYYPVSGLSWKDAKAYCEWAGRRLPLEYEWEKAARGTDGRKYPWGNNEKTTAQKAAGPDFTFLEVHNDPAGQSPYGCLHMADNVWEWVEDWYRPYVLSDVENNKFGEQFKVMRGGSVFGHPSRVLFSKTTDREYSKPELKRAGVRCAADFIDGEQ